jgi:hypothetical protein
MAEVFEQIGPDALLEAISADVESGLVQPLLQVALPGIPSLQPPGANYEGAWHIARPRAEKTALSYLHVPGKPVILWGPHRYGKTWLLDRIIHQWKASSGHAHVVECSCAELIAGQPLDYDCFLRAIARHVIEAVSGPDSAQISLIDVAWSREGTPNLKATWLLSKILSSAGTLLIAIDQADAILEQAYSEDFFALLRSWMGKRISPWPGLRVMMTVSTTPALLTRSIHNSPFQGLSEPIELDSLDLQQTQQLSALHGLTLQADELKTLHELVGGHPHLLRLVFYELALHQTKLGTILAAREECRLFVQYLKRLINWMRSSPDLQDTLSAILRGETVSGHSEAKELLRRFGLIVQDNQGQFRLAARIYSVLASSSGVSPS